MVNRRLSCFVDNCRILAKREGRLYFWTFTLPDKICPREASKAWNRALTYLRRFVPGWSGVRVYEAHTGDTGFRRLFGDPCVRRDSHGLHVHFLATRFYDVGFIGRVVRAAGWGHVWVERVKDRAAAALYMAKYLTKASKAKPPEYRGMRMVGYSGMPERWRLKELKSSGTATDDWRIAREAFGGWRFDALPFRDKLSWLRFCVVQATSISCTTVEWWEIHKADLHRQACESAQAIIGRKDRNGESLTFSERVKAAAMVSPSLSESLPARDGRGTNKQKSGRVRACLN